jgi:prolipoprotein diacylglyceryltransferase
VSFNKEQLKNLASRVNYKCLAGVLILIVGVILFIFSVDATRKIADANTLSQNISNFFEHNPTWNPIIKFFGGKAQEKIEYYNHQTFMIQIGSIVLTALGVVMIVVFRKKKTKKEK